MAFSVIAYLGVRPSRHNFPSVDQRPASSALLGGGTDDERISQQRQLPLARDELCNVGEWL